MLSPRTLKVLATILLAYGILWLPAAFSSAYVDSPVGLLLIAPLLSVYLLHKIGVPGLLERPLRLGLVRSYIFRLAVRWCVLALGGMAFCPGNCFADKPSGQALSCRQKAKAVQA